MDCKDCRSRGCHLCQGCIPIHCTCGDINNNILCLESKPCDCITLSRCKKCYGCIESKDGIYHCNCINHSKNICLCKAILNKDDDIDTLEQSEILRRFSFPSRESYYKKTTKEFLDTRSLYEIIKPKSMKTFANTHKDGNRGVYLDGYVASIERDSYSGLPKYSKLSKAPICFERAMDNSNYLSRIHENLPSETLVDYLIYISSLKTTNLPELLGTMDSSAAIASAIIVEEYIRQEMNAFVSGNQYIHLENEMDLVSHIQELLNGAKQNENLSDIIAQELERIFGKDQLSSYDTTTLIDDEIKFVSNESRDEAFNDWKCSRVRKGIEELENGLMHSEDGIYVTLVQGKPSYWYATIVPDHGKITSEGYGSYQEAWATKFELEQRISMYVPQSEAEEMDPIQSQVVPNAERNIIGRDHSMGMPIPSPTLYFPNNSGMKRIISRIAKPITATEESLHERNQKRLRKKLEHAREETARRKKQKRQTTESTREWIERCIADERCPYCNSHVNHLEENETDNPCLLWKNYQSKLDQDERNRKMTFIECSLEWFIKPKADSSIGE